MTCRRLHLCWSSISRLRWRSRGSSLIFPRTLWAPLTAKRGAQDGCTNCGYPTCMQGPIYGCQQATTRSTSSVALKVSQHCQSTRDGVCCHGGVTEIGCFESFETRTPPVDEKGNEYVKEVMVTEDAMMNVNDPFNGGVKDCILTEKVDFDRRCG
eukprot:2540314-Amphidinium_carterae.1